MDIRKILQGEEEPDSIFNKKEEQAGLNTLQFSFPQVFINLLDGFDINPSVNANEVSSVSVDDNGRMFVRVFKHVAESTFGSTDVSGIENQVREVGLNEIDVMDEMDFITFKVDLPVR